MDKLDTIMQMQRELNDLVFAKKGITSITGETLTSAHLESLVPKDPNDAKIGPNTDTNRWLQNYLTALDDESRELREELLWKWWSKDTLDIQNVRVEIIDMWHFLISLSLTAGLNADDIFSIYQQKHAVNISRQETGYSKTNKSEDDNKSIQ